MKNFNKNEIVQNVTHLISSKIGDLASKYKNSEDIKPILIDFNDYFHIGFGKNEFMDNLYGSLSELKNNGFVENFNPIYPIGYEHLEPVVMNALAISEHIEPEGYYVWVSKDFNHLYEKHFTPDKTKVVISRKIGIHIDGQTDKNSCYEVTGKRQAIVHALLNTGLTASELVKIKNKVSDKKIDTKPEKLLNKEIKEINNNFKKRLNLIFDLIINRNDKYLLNEIELHISKT